MTLILGLAVDVAIHMFICQSGPMANLISTLNHSDAKPNGNLFFNYFGDQEPDGCRLCATVGLALGALKQCVGGEIAIYTGRLSTKNKTIRRVHLQMLTRSLAQFVGLVPHLFDCASQEFRRADKPYF